MPRPLAMTTINVTAPLSHSPYAVQTTVLLQFQQVMSPARARLPHTPHTLGYTVVLRTSNSLSLSTDAISQEYREHTTTIRQSYGEDTTTILRHPYGDHIIINYFLLVMIAVLIYK